MINIPKFNNNDTDVIGKLPDYSRDVILTSLSCYLGIEKTMTDAHKYGVCHFIYYDFMNNKPCLSINIDDKPNQKLPFGKSLRTNLIHILMKYEHLFLTQSAFHISSLAQGLITLSMILYLNFDKQELSKKEQHEFKNVINIFGQSDAIKLATKRLKHMNK